MIVCCGEALIDMIPHAGAGGVRFEPLCGGAAFNTAIALGRLQAPVGLMAGVSGDPFGQQLVRALAQSQVDTSYLIRSNRPTTLAFVSLCEGVASYTFYDENSAGRMLLPGQLPTLSSSVSTLLFSGISLCHEPAADTWLSLAESAAKRPLIYLDPNIRPPFITNKSRYLRRLWAFLELADIVKLSDEDLAWLVGDEGSLAEQVARLTCDSASLVIVTRGPHGASARMNSGAEVSISSHPVDVVDTVGAGDTFNAGVLACLAGEGLLCREALDQLTPQSVEKALQWGAAAAAITVSRAGANPPWLHELVLSG